MNDRSIFHDKIHSPSKFINEISDEWFLNKKKFQSLYDKQPWNKNFSKFD